VAGDGKDEIRRRLNAKRVELDAVALELEAPQTDRMSYLARAKAALPEYASELDHA
jgi:hypothetical protein